MLRYALRHTSFFRYAAVFFVGWLSLISNSVFALGLGEITLKSHLNQPLVAEIELLQVRELVPNEILPGLASRKDFDAAGVERTFLLGMMNFQVKLDANGRNIILVTTPKPVREPFLNFLVEVIWPSGRLLREYTLLLDPPTYANSAPQAIAPAQQSKPSKQGSIARAPTQATTEAPVKKTAPKSEGATPANIYKEPTRSGNARPPSPPKKPASSAVDRASAPSSIEKTSSEKVSTSASVENGEYRVQKNDSLTYIAATMRSDTSANINQVMIAIQRDNPHAFIDNNINLLKKGAVLRVPSTETLSAIDKRTAIQEVERQTKLWKTRLSVAGKNPDALKGRVLNATGEDTTPDAPAKKDQDGGHLRLVAGSADGKSKSGSGGTATTGSDTAILAEEIDKTKLHNQDLQERVTSLSQQVNDSKKLIDLKDRQFAELKARLAEIDAENARLKKQLGMPTTAPTVEPTIEATPLATATEVATEAPVIESTPALPADVTAEVPAATVSEPVEGIEGTQSAAMPEDYNFSEGEPTVAPEPTPVTAPVEAATPVPSAINAFIDDFLHKPFYWMIVGGGLIVLLAAILLWRRSHQEQYEEDEDDNEEEDTLQENTTTLADLDPMSSVTVARNDNPTVLGTGNAAKTVLSKSKDQKFAPGKAAASALQQDTETQALKNIVSDLDDLPDAFDSTDATEEAADILGEADIYIAYGRFDQAEEVLIKAIKRDKTHPEFYLKLMEVYAEKNDLTHFNQTEKQLHSQGFSADFSHRIAELRSTLSNPDATTAKQEVLETLPELQADESRQLESATELDFDLADDDLSLNNAANINDDPTEAMSALDDLESNLIGGDTDPSDAEVKPSTLLDFDAEEETLKFTLDDTNTFTAEPDHHDDIISPTLEPEGLSDDEFLKNIDLDDDSDTDMESLAADLDASLTAAENSLSSTRITDISESTADEIVADEDEVATKLDLARAYMDMGDREGAKDILDEVIKDGSSAQQQEAQSLLKKIS
jgi:pilus assembly protein FimV